MTELIGGPPTPTRSGEVPRRGEVWLAELDRDRPVIILTRNPMGAYLSALIAVPVTATLRGTRNEVPVGASDGIRYDSAANIDNLTSVRLDALIARVGQVRPQTLQALCEALAFTVACRKVLGSRRRPHQDCPDPTYNQSGGGGIRTLEGLQQPQPA
jgi:mRNA interferase MazF